MTYFLKQQVTALGGLKVSLLSAETVSLESKVPGLVRQLAVWSTKHFDHVLIRSLEVRGEVETSWL